MKKAIGFIFIFLLIIAIAVVMVKSSITGAVIVEEECESSDEASCTLDFGGCGKTECDFDCNGSCGAETCSCK